MERKSFNYQVEAVLELSREELDLLLVHSQQHYDGYCRSVGQPGEGAFLHGATVCQDYNQGGRITVSWTFRQIDTCCKLLEHPVRGFEDKAAAIYMALCRAGTDIKHESDRLYERETIVKAPPVG